MQSQIVLIDDPTDESQLEWDDVTDESWKLQNFTSAAISEYH